MLTFEGSDVSPVPSLSSQYAAARLGHACLKLRVAQARWVTTRMESAILQGPLNQGLWRSLRHSPLDSNSTQVTKPTSEIKSLATCALGTVD